jgi:hypothetical protein
MGGLSTPKAINHDERVYRVPGCTGCAAVVQVLIYLSKEGWLLEQRKVA